MLDTEDSGDRKTLAMSLEMLQVMVLDTEYLHAYARPMVHDTMQRWAETQSERINAEREEI